MEWVIGHRVIADDKPITAQGYILKRCVFRDARAVALVARLDVKRKIISGGSTSCFSLTPN